MCKRSEMVGVPVQQQHIIQRHVIGPHPANLQSMRNRNIMLRTCDHTTSTDPSSRTVAVCECRPQTSPPFTSLTDSTVQPSISAANQFPGQ